ncbi:MAG: hypothetical protein ACTSPY_12895 [Candidatus Helarchaeota archaeon]
MPLILVKFPEEMSKKVNMSRFLSKYSKLDISVVVEVQINELNHILEILKRNDCKITIAEIVEDQIIKTLLPIIKNIRLGSTEPRKVGEYCKEVLDKYGENNLKPEILEIMRLCEEFSSDLKIDTLNKIQNNLELQLNKTGFNTYSTTLTIDLDTFLMLYHVQKGEFEFKDFSKFNRYSAIYLKLFNRYEIIKGMEILPDWKEKVRILFDRVSVKGINIDPENKKALKIWWVLENTQNYITKEVLLNRLDISPGELSSILEDLLNVQLIYIRKNQYKTRQLGIDLYNFVIKQVEKRFKFKPSKIIPKTCENFISALIQLSLLDISVILERAKKPIKRITFHRLSINIEKYY